METTERGKQFQPDLFGDRPAGVEAGKTPVSRGESNLGAVPAGDGAEGNPRRESAYIREKSGAAPILSKEEREMRMLATSPYWFAKDILKIPVYDGLQKAPAKRLKCIGPDGRAIYEVDHETDWQKRVLLALNKNGARVSLRTANGSGKTSTILVAAIFWHMMLFPNSLVISTAGVDRQVRAQLWPNLRKHATKFPGWVFHESSLTIEAPNGSRYIGFTTDKPERAEGWHGFNAEKAAEQADEIGKLTASHTGPLFIIVDEAKGVPQGIFEAFDRCTFHRLLYCSSPGVSDGEFFKSQTAKGYEFERFVIPASLCPHADHDKNAQTIRKRGIDHPLVRSAIFAEFMGNEQGFVITPQQFDDCVNNPPAFVPGVKRGFCDFAAGGDENIFYDCNGNKAKLAKAWRQLDTMKAADEFIEVFVARGFTKEKSMDEIAGDADGLGIVIIHRLRQLGWHIREYRNGGPADNPEEYYNFGTETWLEGAERIRRREIILEGMDDETRAQVIGRRQTMTDKGKMSVETKREMKARGLDSPDRADGLFACIRKPMATAPLDFMGNTAERGVNAPEGWMARARAEAEEHADDGRDYSLFAGASCE